MMKSEISFQGLNKFCNIDQIIEKIILDVEKIVLKIDSIKDLGNLLTYYLKIRSKRIRLIKMILVAKITGGLSENVLRVIHALELSNSAIFLHDDIIDHDEKRKGVLTINNLIGYEKGLLIGNALHTLAIKYISEIETSKRLKQKILLDFAESLFLEHLGQYMDIEYRWDFNHNLHAWERMVLRHSGFYVISALKSISLLNDSNEKIVKSICEFEKNCTLAGAAEDALMGFIGKKTSGDIKNGSFTILVNFANLSNNHIHKNPAILKQRIESSNAIELTKEYIHQKVSFAIDALRDMGDSYHKRGLIFLAKQIEEGIK